MRYRPAVRSVEGSPGVVPLGPTWRRVSSSPSRWSRAGSPSGGSRPSGPACCPSATGCSGGSTSPTPTSVRTDMLAAAVRLARAGEPAGGPPVVRPLARLRHGRDGASPPPCTAATGACPGRRGAATASASTRSRSAARGASATRTCRRPAAPRRRSSRSGPTSGSASPTRSGTPGRGGSCPTTWRCSNARSPAEASAPARVSPAVRRWFEEHTHRTMRNGLEDGSDLDVTRYVDHYIDAAAGGRVGGVAEPRVFRDLVPEHPRRHHRTAARRQLVARRAPGSGLRARAGLCRRPVPGDDPGPGAPRRVRLHGQHPPPGRRAVPRRTSTSRGSSRPAASASSPAATRASAPRSATSRAGSWPRPPSGGC